MNKALLTLVILLGWLSHLPAQQSKSYPQRPQGVSKGILNKKSKNQVLINGVPSYIWHHGCGPTALGMLLGYYDGNGFPNLFPGDASSQTQAVNNAIANQEHYNDYSEPIDYYPDLYQDKSELGGAHTSNCIADYMRTSWSAASNRYGWSWAIDVLTAFNQFVNQQDSTYHTEVTYQMFAPEKWEAYKNEIDQQRPVVILVDSDGDGTSDHFVTGIGYDDSDTTYGIYDTWDHNIHWYKWRGMSSAYQWGIYGFGIFKLKFEVQAYVNPSGGGTVTGQGNFFPGDSVTLTAVPAEGYAFVNWMENGTVVSDTPEYSFVITASRYLTVNFEQIGATEVDKNTEDIKIFPNPANDYFTVRLPNLEANTRLELFDKTGKLILTQALKSKQTVINIQNLEPGAYTVTILSPQNHFHVELLKPKK